jgi:hypothetical protein
VNVSTRVLRAALWSVWKVVPQPASLRDALQSQAVVSRQLIAAGVIKSNTANGHTTVFADQGLSGKDVVESWVLLVDFFDVAKQQLQEASQPTDDEAIFQQMDQITLRSRQGFQSNFMYLSK